MNISIVSNNCSGVRLLQDLKMRYDSPTIAIQIMPEEYTKFCANFRYYMEQDFVEYKDFSEEHKKYFANMYGGVIDYPVGICGDIAMVCQHDNSFGEAKAKWDRRKARIDYDNLVFLFCLDNPRYVREAEEFSKADIPRSFIFTRDFDIEGNHYRYSVPNKKLCFLDKDRPDHYYFEGDFDRKLLWRNT